MAYSVLWAAWWGYRLVLGGGLETPGEAATMAISGVGCALGLLLGWQVRRQLGDGG